jgi:glycosyltransferase involved in cell wall biosynthesis
LGGITLVIPTRDEGTTLASVVRDWWDHRPEGIPYEILVVDDASTDRTPEVLQELSTEVPFRMVRNRTALGFGGSLCVGIRDATTEWVTFTDADGQYVAEDLPKLLDALAAGSDLATGWRTPRADPFHRIAISVGFRGLLYAFFDLRSRDPTTSLKAGRTESVRATAESVRYMNGSFWNEFMIRWIRAGHSFTEVTIRHRPRQEGKSKVAAGGLLLRVSVQQFIALLRAWREFHRPPAIASVQPEPVPNEP